MISYENFWREVNSITSIAHGSITDLPSQGGWYGQLTLSLFSDEELLLEITNDHRKKTVKGKLSKTWKWAKKIQMSSTGALGIV